VIQRRDLTTRPVVSAMDESNPYSPPHPPLSRPRDLIPASRAAMVGAMMGSLVLIPVYLALFVMGRDPNGDGPWGWCLESVMLGFGVGTLYGAPIGGGIGWIVGAIRKRSQRRSGRVNGSITDADQERHL
jgi:hypothetical protein